MAKPAPSALLPCALLRMAFIVQACDYTKQYFDKNADACKNVKACKDGETYSDKPLFADWTCAAAATDCLDEKELCRAHKGKTGRFAVCNTGDYVFCESKSKRFCGPPTWRLRASEAYNCHWH